MNRVVALVLCLWSLVSFGQQVYFNKLYDINGSDYGLNVLKHHQGYLVSGGGSDTTWTDG